MKMLPTVVCTLALLAAACGDDDAATGPGGGPTTTVAAPTTEATRWLEGDDLAWSESDDGGARASESAPAAGGDDAAADGVDRTGAPAPTVSPDGRTDPVPPIEPPVEPAVADAPLRAGSIDDAEDVAAYLHYRTSITDAGVAVRPLDVSDSTVIRVTGANDLPVLDAVVEVAAAGSTTDDRRTELRTTADGTARFLPGAMAPAGGDDWTLTVTVGDIVATGEFVRGAEIVDVAVDAPGGMGGSVPLDVHFLLDATGSMGDEIGRLRDNMRTVATRIDALPSEPDVRFGMTVYRDEGDLFVTRNFDLTEDLEAFLDGLDDVTADGGGDYPEALDEALADALEKPSWRRDGAVELVVLLADAPPQIARQVDAPYTATVLDAAARGVKIFPVAASGTDDQAEYVMRELAFVTGGRFVFLTYGVAGSATGGGSDITPDDYDELPLDELVVRLVEDEILALTGGTPSPTTTTTTTTVPVTTTTYQQ